MRKKTGLGNSREEIIDYRYRLNGETVLPLEPANQRIDLKSNDASGKLHLTLTVLPLEPANQRIDLKSNDASGKLHLTLT